MPPDPALIQEHAQKYGRLIARAWTDPAFKARLVADPAGVLREQGIDVPEGVQIRTIEQTSGVVYLPLPPPPPEQLSDEQLARVAEPGGAATSGITPIINRSQQGE